MNVTGVLWKYAGGWVSLPLTVGCALDRALDEARPQDWCGDPRHGAVEAPYITYLYAAAPDGVSSGYRRAVLQDCIPFMYRGAFYWLQSGSRFACIIETEAGRYPALLALGRDSALGEAAASQGEAFIEHNTALTCELRLSPLYACKTSPDGGARIYGHICGYQHVLDALLDT